MKTIPWAEGRQALVLCDLTGQWHEARGGTYRGDGEWLGTFPDPDLGHTEWCIPNGAPTAPLPNQCFTCYEVGSHAEGCRVAVNLAAGVPAFWAPWAHNTIPRPVKGHALLMLGGSGDTMTVIARMTRINEMEWESDNERWWLTQGPWKNDGYLAAAVCLGPDGTPTNEPWEAG